MDDRDHVDTRLLFEPPDAPLAFSFAPVRATLTIRVQGARPQAPVLLADGVAVAQVQLVGPAAAQVWAALAGGTPLVPQPAAAPAPPTPAEPARTAAARRVRPPRRLRLQPRDVAVLAALAETRVLTAQGIEWLFFPWRARYQALRAQDRLADDRPAGNVYSRLRALAQATPPLLVPLPRLTEQVTRGSGRLDGAYMLTEAGAELVAAQQGRELHTLCYQRRRLALRNLEHSVQIGHCYAALRAAAAHTGVALTAWQVDSQLMQRDGAGTGAGYDRVAVPRGRAPLAVLPDATCVLAGRRHFVEIDRGTMPLRAWAEKVLAYEAYVGSAALQARYGVADFVVLVVCPDATRQRRIAEEVVKVTRGATGRYWFVLVAQVHPVTIRAGGQVIQAVTWTRRQVVDRLVAVPASLTFGSARLWEVQS